MLKFRKPILWASAMLDIFLIVIAIKYFLSPVC